jgi:hypothetical protein
VSLSILSLLLIKLIEILFVSLNSLMLDTNTVKRLEESAKNWSKKKSM